MGGSWAGALSPQVSFPRMAGRLCYADVLFGSRLQLLTAGRRVFRLNGGDVVPILWGPSIPFNVIPILLHCPARTPSTAVLPPLHEMIAHYNAFHCPTQPSSPEPSRLSVMAVWSHRHMFLGMGTRVVTGTSLALLPLPVDPPSSDLRLLGLTNGLVFPSQAASRIPGYLKVGLDRVPLSFRGLVPTCNICKETRVDGAFHVLEDCKRRACNNCGRPGHFARDCPEAEMNDDDAVAAPTCSLARKPHRDHFGRLSGAEAHLLDSGP